MKILQTPVRFHPFIGGVENYVYNLSREMVKLGHQVTVICANEPKGKREEVIEGIKIKRLEYVGKIANTNVTPWLPFVLLKEDFDLIHTQMPTPWSADWSVLMALVKRKPLVLTYHNDIVGNGFTHYIAWLYNHTILKLVLNNAKKIIITHDRYLNSSPYLKKYEDKIRILSVGVDLNKFKPVKRDGNGNKLSFLSVLDKFHEYKGLDCLLSSLVIVKETIPDVKLVVGGEGELTDPYKRRVSRLGLDENVDFIGFIPEDEIVQFYNECDVFVLPSVSAEQEGFGIVLLEAMACGKPVISTDIVGTADDIQRMNAGLIVKPGNETELAEAVLNLLGDKEKAVKMGSSGRMLVEEKYSWVMEARILDEVYKSIVGIND